MLEVGSTIAGYRLDAVLGRGGMGVVYEATQLALDRTVALKLLAPHLGGDPAFRRRFQREGSVQARLDHPHIVTVYEAGESQEGLFLAMRLVRGPTLKDMIVSRELDAGRALRLLTPIGEAVDAAHDAGLIHRDIKPQNILVGGRDHAWLADFGLTKASGETAVTKSGQFVGTLDYISPEQISDYEATQLSDIYSLGGVLYEALVGSVPFPKKSEAAVIYAHLQLDPPRVSDQRPELPRELDDVIARAMAKDPAERYPRAHELLRAATEAFDRRSRAVLRTPAPIESPEQLGVRAPETTVPTEERPREPGATVGATVPGGSPREKLRPRPALIAATVAALVLLAGIGFLAAKPGKSTSRSASIAASAGSLSVAIPSEWRPLAQRLSAPGITVRDPLAVGPPGVASGGLVVGQAPASGAALVPTRFLKSSGNPKPALVRIGRLEGYRYGPVTPAGFHREVAVYAVPTSRGVATSQCYATAPGQAFLAACERVVSTLRLDGGRAYPVRPSAEYAHSLDTALAPVRTARATAPSLLRHAKTLPAQGAVAARIGAAYARAGTQVRLVDGGPRVSGAQARLASALERVGRAYASSAAAARRHSASGYRTAARAVTSAGREVAAAAKAFGPLGYVIPV